MVKSVGNEQNLLDKEKNFLVVWTPQCPALYIPVDNKLSYLLAHQQELDLRWWIWWKG